VSAPQRLLHQPAADITRRPDDRDFAHATFSFPFTAFAPASSNQPVYVAGK
jgi:hypothetical protein